MNYPQAQQPPGMPGGYDAYNAYNQPGQQQYMNVGGFNPAEVDPVPKYETD